ncbi:YeeE/YedE family protein [Paraglaciecola chathamensis]|jgi:uncharacterized membrane protein YedE/YeeE|uniref:Sulphur transport domain-containing protein n=1 Tax=Paraglaciecola chathamensis TaxID=368405 RepID=A0A8H9M2Y2_9ALTE|nr:YeeE/YedE thiosulfate transporter family protein [Paraglaciecola oceanifecundans]AEE25378.1 protein of unknown function DUF395 YeeE/YedE [Glaciecola sp. 4H-3-7+YE-5]GGZ80044.1 hypothetical protein GCM10011274_42460 [Paraglaciecola oceanifecundans]|tara:strand:+ start:17928 stop:18359 length:432 start_codon:yes stop_codon:yes gene_type:complete
MENWTITPFEPWAGLAGGMLVGAAVVLLLLTLGRIAGISGIAAGAMTKRAFERHWRWAFLTGLLLAPLLYTLIVGPFPVQTQIGSLWMMVAGLLVGFGTRLGSGCTSGHGVAGIARLSRRSVIATLVFVGGAALTVNVTRHFF